MSVGGIEFLQFCTFIIQFKHSYRRSGVLTVLCRKSVALEAATDVDIPHCFVSFRHTSTRCIYNILTQLYTVYIECIRVHLTIALRLTALWRCVHRGWSEKGNAETLINKESHFKSLSRSLGGEILRHLVK